MSYEAIDLIIRSGKVGKKQTRIVTVIQQILIQILQDRIQHQVMIQTKQV